MSDPVTNVEIEDVLSSIRRLVSEDARPRQAVANPMADRLVLTPSQRVAEPDLPSASEDEAPDDAGTEPQDPIVLTDYAADPAPDVKAPALEDSADISLTESEGAPHAVQSPAPAIEAEDHGVVLTDPDGPDIPHDAEPAPTFAASAPENADEGADDATDTAQDDTLARMVEHEVASALSGFSKKAAPLETAEDRADTVEDIDESGKEGEPELKTKSPSLEQKVAQLEAMIAGTEGDWEHEEPASDDAAAFLQDASDAMPWRDYDAGADNDAETGKTAQTAAAATAWDADQSAVSPETPRAKDDPTKDVAPEAPPAADIAGAAKPDTTGDADMLTDDAPLIDEDMLRDMVAEIVRQELQGALGERITRNVRKLVRREIHRALLSQNLE